MRIRTVMGAALALAVLAAAGGPVAASGPTRSFVADPVSTTVDLGPALAPDGRFQGRAGLQGKVDVKAWALTSDLARGDAPRFERRSTRPGPTGAPGSISDLVLAVAVSGSNLYVGGWFQDAGGNQWADFIARWDGVGWRNLGKDQAGIDGALTGYVADIAISGSSIYVGGGFLNAAGLARADSIARWNGTRWYALGADDTGTDGALRTGPVTAIAIFQEDVYVGGSFTAAADIQVADYIARWDGAAWHAVGTGPTGGAALKRAVTALTATGKVLYVGGLFMNAFGNPRADLIARWNGVGWSALGGDAAGTDGGLGKPFRADWVSSIAVDGNVVYVGGKFDLKDGFENMGALARWNGQRWSGVRNAFFRCSDLCAVVYSIVVTDDFVYVGGEFPWVGDVPRSMSIGRFDGAHWGGLGKSPAGGSALNGPVHAIAVSPTGLVVGGAFTSAAQVAGADHLARFKSGHWSEVD